MPSLPLMRKSDHLSLLEHVFDGEAVRSFALDPSGRYLLAANQNSDTIVVFSIDAKSGAVRPTGNVRQQGVDSGLYQIVGGTSD